MKLLKPDNSHRYYVCHECGKEDVATVQLGENPDNYESYNACVCRECLKKALELIP